MQMENRNGQSASRWVSLNYLSEGKRANFEHGKGGNQKPIEKLAPTSLGKRAFSRGHSRKLRALLASGSMLSEGTPFPFPKISSEHGKREMGNEDKTRRPGAQGDRVGWSSTTLPVVALRGRGATARRRRLQQAPELVAARNRHTPSRNALKSPSNTKLMLTMGQGNGSVGRRTGPDRYRLEPRTQGGDSDRRWDKCRQPDLGPRAFAVQVCSGIQFVVARTFKGRAGTKCEEWRQLSHNITAGATTDFCLDWVSANSLTDNSRWRRWYV